MYKVFIQLGGETRKGKKRNKERIQMTAILKVRSLRLRPSVDGRGSNKPVRPSRVPRDDLSWNSLNFILKETKR